MLASLGLFSLAPYLIFLHIPELLAKKPMQALNKGTKRLKNDVENICYFENAHGKI